MEQPGDFEKQMAAGFFCSELEALCKDVDAFLRLRKEARGKDTVPMEHLQALASVLNDINEHSASAIDNLRAVVCRAETQTFTRCPACGGHGRSAGLECGICAGTGRI